MKGGAVNVHSVFKCRLPIAEHFLRPNSEALKQQEVKFQLLASPSRRKVASGRAKLRRLTVPQDEVVLRMGFDASNKEAISADPDAGDGGEKFRTLRLKMSNENKRTECLLPISYLWELCIPDTLGEKDTQTQSLFEVAGAETGLDIEGLIEKRENPTPRPELDEMSTQCEQEVAEIAEPAQYAIVRDLLRDNIVRGLRETEESLE
ncbi:hypothetical protein SprV_0502002200 [Sparganum proliferum]